MSGPEGQHRRRPRCRARRRQLTSPQPWNVGTIQWTNGWKPAGSSGGLSCSAGGATAIPRWTLDPAPGVAEHVAALDDDLGAAVRRLADELELPLHSVALAAHAKVLAALSGEQDVVTGYAGGPGGRPLPCPLRTEARSWRSLLQDTCRVESDLLRHRDFAVDELRRELGVAGPAFETEFDPIGSLGTGGTISTGLAEDTVLRLAIVKRGGQLALHLRYRTDALDPGSAERIAGYHLTALALMVADPGAEHGRANLLSDEELRFQFDGLAGPRRELPDRRFHELFEQRVRMHPDAVAAVHRDRQWTYRELNAHANRLARALLTRGLRREGVVAVVTERNLDWMAAVIAIFKAGGAYLPIEPHFPADRIATMLARAECTLVLSELGSTTMLDKALDTLTGVEMIIIEEACAEGHAADDPGVAVAADQLAYIYFTSGSTGEPKGAMCEHAGLLNHLNAKIDDLGVGPAHGASVVAQTAPQCFDISLWQLVSALLVGGRTLIVEQEVILDVAQYVDTIVHGRVGVLQVVPSYLEVVLTYLEQHPRRFPDLRCVSATGEALKKELVQRWFAVAPRDQTGQRVRADRDLRRHQSRGHGAGARLRPDPARSSYPQRARLRRRRAPVTGAPRRPRRDRLLRRLRRPRVRQRSRAHPASLHGRPAPAGPAALPRR